MPLNEKVVDLVFVVDSTLYTVDMFSDYVRIVQLKILQLIPFLLNYTRQFTLDNLYTGAQVSVVSAFQELVTVNIFLNDSNSYTTLADKIRAIPNLDNNLDVSPDLGR